MDLWIDAGHGGKDPGAKGVGFYEKDFNLKMSLYLARRFRELKRTVGETRITDVTVADNDPRTAPIRASKAKIILSIHGNAFNGLALGCEVIHSIHSDGRLANLIFDGIKATGMPGRKVFCKALSSDKTADYYYMIRQTRPQETVIIEYGFVDNPYDAKRLTDNLESLGEATVKAVCTYMDWVYSAPAVKKTLTELELAVDYLNTVTDPKTKQPIIVDKTYWKAVAVKGGKPNPEWVGSLIIKFANVLKNERMR